MARAIEFSRRMNQIAANVTRNTVRAKVSSALEMHRAVVELTPANTGRARSNWLVSVGSPRGEEIPPYAPGKNLGIRETANASAAISQGKSAVSSVGTGPGSSETTIFIQNNTKYIGDLNRGSSSQSPGNFIELAILRGREVLAAARLLK